MSSYEVEGIGTIVYHEYGDGDQYLFAFHGYGMNGKQFQNLPKYLLSKYKVIGINLFFHEGSTIAKPSLKNIQKGFLKNDLKKLIEPLIVHFSINNFAVAGYSIGSNFALSLVEFYADRINQIYLFAPDGIQSNSFLKAISSNQIANYLFRKITFHNSFLPQLLKITNWLKFLNDELFGIAYAEIDTLEKRKQVYNCLTYQKNIVPNITSIESNIRKYEIPTVLIFGKNDQLFPKAVAHKFLLNYAKKTVFEFDFGHYLLLPSLDEELNKLK